MNYVTYGVFVDATISEKPSKKYPDRMTCSGTMLVELDNSYESQGEKVEKTSIVPFSVFGKTAEKVRDNYKYGEKVKVTFDLVGREYQGKNYVNVNAIFVNHVEPGATEKVLPGKSEQITADDIPF